MPGNIINLTPEDILKWPKPNYVDPVERAWMPPYAGCLYGLATVMVGLRLWLRWTKRAGGLGVDDILLVASWLCVSWFTVLAILSAELYHTSRHVWDIPITSFPPMAKVTWLAELSFLLTGCCVKVSVLLFYRRLTESTCSKFWIWAVWAAIGLTVSYTLAFILALVFNCSPTEAYWRAFDLRYAATVDYHCVDTTIINLLAGIMAVISDLYAVALPCIMMRNLRIPLHQKIALNVVFSLGLLVVGASGVRTYWLWRKIRSPSSSPMLTRLPECGHYTDVSSAIFNVFVWSQLELTLGIMCASAPSLRVLFREYLSDTISRIKRSVTSGRSRRDSDVEQVIIRRVDSPNRVVERVDFAAKKHHHTPTCSDASAKFSDPITMANVNAVLPHEQWGDEGQYSYDWSYRKSPTLLERALTREERGTTAPTPPEQFIVKTPEDFESYNLQNMERYRASTQARGSEEVTRTLSAQRRHFEPERGVETSQSWLSLDR
ncbi:hypothetical protein PRZ48_005667 [Zasmidium cellare]|uniref:Rhodopsin domain-containing protein n=1 Tax=Zasmidium cellare TaxID=395010 RepID=A0ABR0EL84_ZASCE|nr:hypothetical protein PRZ48_005667 [Zasmidium cellare]